jgi:hypothetical protein
MNSVIRMGRLELNSEVALYLIEEEARPFDGWCFL